jgi:predicted hydrolase (HD superfamily)
MERAVAWKNLKKHVKEPINLEKALVMESIMRWFGRHYRDDEEKWAMVGLLYNIDEETTRESPELRGLRAAEMLEAVDADEYIVYAVQSLNEESGLERKRRLDKILFSAAAFIDELAAEYGSMNLEEIRLVDHQTYAEKLMQRADSEDPAAERIVSCMEASLDLSQFIRICIGALDSVESKD